MRYCTHPGVSEAGGTETGHEPFCNLKMEKEKRINMRKRRGRKKKRRRMGT